MKNVIKLIGIIAIVAIIGFSMTTCDDGNSNGGNGTDQLKGTWTAGQMEWKFNNGSYELKENGKLDEKGTYTTRASSRNTVPSKGIMELTPTHINGENWYINSPGDLESQWYSKEDLKNKGIGDAVLDTIFEVEEKDYEINDITLTLDGTPYTKQGSSNVPGGSGEWIKVADSKFGESNILDIAWGNGKFIAVGGNSKMAYSSDGINWTAVNISSNFGFSSISWANDRFFVGAGNAGKAAYSTDGIDWTEIALGTPIYQSVSRIAYGGGKYVAVGPVGSMAYSNNGINWNQVTHPFGSSNINDVVWGNDRFVAVGSYNQIAYSTDGETFIEVTDNTYGTTLYDSVKSIIWDGSKFVVTRLNGRISYSVNGTVWTPVTDSKFQDNGINSITWSGNRFVAVGSRGIISHSVDCINWTAAKDSVEVFGYLTNINGVAWGNNKFVAVGSSGKMAYWQP